MELFKIVSRSSVALKINDRDYDRFVNLGDRILHLQSASYLAKDFLSPYREPIGELVNQRLITEPYVDAETGKSERGDAQTQSVESHFCLRV